MKESIPHLGTTTGNQHRQGRRWGWLKAGLLFTTLVLILGFTMAGSAGSDIKAADRPGQAFNKDAPAWLASTDFQFTGQGWIVGGVGNTWLINGVPIEIGEHTQINSGLNAGDPVTLSGRISGSGAWLADRIEGADIQQAVFTFNGLLRSIDGDNWQIGSKTLALNAQSEVDTGLAVDDPVLATFTPLEDGTWLALKIEPFDQPWVEPTPIPTLTPTPSPEATEEVQRQVAPPKKSEPSEKKESSGKPAKNQDKVTICHNPGHKNGGQTMTVDGPALQSHLNHGDRTGSCR